MTSDMKKFERKVDENRNEIKRKYLDEKNERIWEKEIESMGLFMQKWILRKITLIFKGNKGH